MKKALLFALQNTNMVLGSKFLDWSSQRQHDQASPVKLWRGKVLSCSCSTNPASCLASLQDGREIPVVEKHGWKHYNMAALLAPPAESLMHWYISFTKMLRSGKPAFRNLQGTALKISAHHVISRRNPLAQRAEEVSARGESSLNCSKAHQIKATSWSNDSPHPEFRHAFNLQYNPSKEVQLSARPHETILPWLPSWPDHPAPSLASGHVHGTASPFRDANEN